VCFFLVLAWSAWLGLRCIITVFLSFITTFFSSTFFHVTFFLRGLFALSHLHFVNTGLGLNLGGIIIIQYGKHGIHYLDIIIILL